MNNNLGCKSDNLDPHCTAHVHSITEQISDSMVVTPTTIAAGNVVVKMPVVIAETRVVIPVVSDIRLESAAFEIKRIKKNVYVTQCHLIPNSSNGFPNTGIVYIEGFVRKNIEYATQDCMSHGVVSGRINHTTVNVFFRTTTRVTFLRAPQFTANATTLEFERFNDTLRTCDACAENVVGKDPCQEEFQHNEVFNEKVYCELVSADIVEADIHKKPKFINHNNPQEQTFTNITEKLVLDLTLKILQNQQVTVAAL